MRALALLVLASLAGCLGAGSVTCADGRVCPAGTICVDERDLCVTRDQMEQCEGHADGDACDYPGDQGVCVGEICVRVGCGDGFVNLPEECDGAELLEQDCTDFGFHEVGSLACHDDCTIDTSACGTRCGDGEINGTELCDGTDLGGQDCTDFHFYEPDGLSCAACTFDASACRGFCGDELVNGGEICDGLPATEDTCTTFGYAAGVMSCSPFCSPGFDSCLRLGWQISLSAPAAGRFEDIWGTGDDNVYAVGEHGAYHWNGVAWAIDPSLPDLHFMGVWAAGPGEVFAVGLGGIIYHRDTSAWTAMTSGTIADLHAVWGAGGGNVYAVGDQVILHYDGASWSTVLTPSTVLRDISGTGASDIYAVGEDGNVYHRNATGWSIVYSDPTFALLAVWASDDDDVIVAGESGATGYWNGVAWTDERGLLSSNVNCLWEEWAATENGSFLRWGGAIWDFRTGPSNEVTGMWGVGPGRIYAVGADGLLMSYDGVALQHEGIAFAGPISDIALAADRSAVAVSHAGDILVRKGTDLGWTQVGGFAGTDLAAVWSADWSFMLAVGKSGAVLRGNALSWTTVDIGTTADLNDVWGSSLTDIYVVGNAVVRHWDGFVWSPVGFTGLGSSNWISVWGSGPDDVWLVGKGPPASQPVSRHWDGSSWSFVPAITSAVVVEGAGATVVAMSDTLTRIDGAFVSDITVGLHDGASLSQVRDIAVASRSDIMAVGDHGFMAHFDGVAWRPVASTTFQEMDAIAYRDGVWLAASDTGVIFSVFRDGAPAEGCFGATVEVACGNGADDDCDFLVDGKDPDCADDGVCWRADELPCGIATAGSTVGGAITIDGYGCAAAPRRGAEHVYKLVPAASGELDVTISGISGGDPDLYAFGAAAGTDACDPASRCLATSVADAPSQTLAVSVTAGQPVYIAVDTDGIPADYTLEATCP